jgi:hypothetical protein
MDEYMTRQMVWLAGAVAIAVIFGGCCGGQAGKQTNRICAQGVDKQAAMDAAQNVLEEMHFVIEKADANAGYISTRPLAAGQFFELWRSDTVGCENFAEANLHSITRIAELTFKPVDGTVCIECRVDTRRLSMPQREVSSATELPRVFTRSSGSLQTLSLNKEQRKEAVWMDMGQDVELQTKILERIKTQIMKM